MHVGGTPSPGLGSKTDLQNPTQQQLSIRQTLVTHRQVRLGCKVFHLSRVPCAASAAYPAGTTFENEFFFPLHPGQTLQAGSHALLTHQHTTSLLPCTVP